MSLVMSHYDYVVVGGGTAGVTIASRLKQYLPDARICLAEAGPNAVQDPDVNDTNIMRTLLALLQKGLAIDYSTTPQKHMNNQVISNAAGRFLSGSSGVNLGVWMRASSSDHKVMARMAGHDRFEFQNMVKYFKRIETHFDSNAKSEFYGFEGLLHTVGGRKYPLRDALQQSAEVLGHKYYPNRSEGNTIGVSDLVQNFRVTSDSTTTRQHSGKVYDLSGVDVLCDALAARILLDEDKRACGVELIDGRRISAGIEVIVSCGTQKTPQLLMLSGIGPTGELSKHKIPVLVESPGVGQNLSDHMSMAHYYKVKDSSQAFPFHGNQKPYYNQGFHVDFTIDASIPSNDLRPYVEQDRQNRTITSSSPSILEEERSHVMIVPFYTTLLTDPSVWPDAKQDGTVITMTSLVMLPTARGTVTLASPNPQDNPICDPNFLSTETDRYIWRRAVRETLALVETEPFASQLAGEVTPADPRYPPLTSGSSDEDIDARVRQFAVTIYHPMGTCALGTVLDDEFKVKGVTGLRVCDASVFPEPIAAMPSCTIYALAEMCADLIAGRGE